MPIFRQFGLACVAEYFRYLWMSKDRKCLTLFDQRHLPSFREAAQGSMYTKSVCYILFVNVPVVGQPA